MLQALIGPKYRPLVLAVVGGLAFQFGVAQAQTALPPQPASPAGVPVTKPPKHKRELNLKLMNLPESDRAKYQQMDKLVFHGWLSIIPGYENTLLQDVGGWRSALASAGFGFSVQSVNLWDYDIAQAGGNLKTQYYNGQKLTLQTSYQTGILTFDTGKIGIPNGQIVLMGSDDTNGYESKNGTDGWRMREFYWYQSMGDNKVQTELGITATSNEFVGTHVGADLAGGALGPQASILVETGMSYSQYGAPAASILVNWTPEFYTHTAIQRSLEPVGGGTAEDKDNPQGWTFSVPGGKPLYIQEFGYNKAATSDSLYSWIRGGGDYNTSNYTLYTHGTPRNNHMVYLSGDQQVLQTSDESPIHGVYVGASVQAAPESMDLIDRYYEARVYVKAPFQSRPLDMTSFVVNYSGYSREGATLKEINNFDPFSATATYTVSYNFFVMHGLYFQAGLSLIKHPVYNRNIGNAVNALMGVVAYF